MVLAQGVENDMCASSTVVDIAKDVQLVDSQSLDDVANGDNEVVGTACGDDGIDDDIDVSGLVDVIGAFVKQFLNDIAEILGQRFAHLGTRIFRRHITADGYKTMDGDVIPVVEIFLVGFDEFEFLFGIVYECAQFATLGFADIAFEELADLAADVSGGILQYVLKGCTLSMQIGQEVFRAFWQVHNGLEIDNLRRCCRNSRKRIGEQLQVVHVAISSSRIHSHYIFRCLSIVVRNCRVLRLLSGGTGIKPSVRPVRSLISCMT